MNLNGGTPFTAQGGMRKTREYYVADTALHLALRRVRVILGSAKTWGILLALSVLLGVSGPFDTADLLRFGPRLAYWFAVSFSTFTVGAFIHALLAQIPALQKYDMWTRLGAAGFLTGIVVGLVLLGINWLAFGLHPIQAGYTLLILGNAVVVSLVVSVIFGLFPKPQADTVMTLEPTRILQRLDIHKRGALISLSVRDHYVEIATSMGQDLVLLRLSDAMSETAGVNGLQVHRSHWVALGQVVSATRNGDKAVLLMSNGRKIPVSRSYVKAVRDVGLLAG